MIIWIASYPKSGNTLVRAMLSSLLFSKDGNFNINDLQYMSNYPESYHFEGITNKLSRIDDIKKFWTISQDKINKNNKINFLKTHHLRCGINNYTFTNSKNTLATIYIVRDPRDVIVSFSKHYNISLEKAKEAMFDHQAMIQLEKGKNPNMDSDLAIRTLLGSWSDHYNSWTKNNKNLLFLKYENLIKNKKIELLKIIKFINNYIKINVNESKIENCINSTAFENMKKQEENGLFNENSFYDDGKKIKFFNSGKEGNWKNVLSKEILLGIEKKFEREMKELEYI